MKVTLTNGKEINLTIIREADGNTTYKADIELSEAEADEIINMDVEIEE